ncbi:MAG: IclR family transcriptional regulator [Desulfomonile tiedjei]|nr:IclR family transcriptional regulator [Desulfomonile tiedjei]
MGKLTSLEKGLRLLDAVAKAKSIGLRELAAGLGFPPSTVHRLSGILTACHFLTQDPESKKYRLSLKFLELGAAVREDLDVISAARPHMSALVEATSETVNLAFFDSAEVIYVDQVANSNSLLRMFTRVGTRAPLHCTGVGKARLAALPDELVAEYWRSAKKERFTVNTIADEPSLGKELQVIRRLGYAVDNEEMEIGVRCVACLIRQNRTGIVAALSISGPSSRLTADKVPFIGELVRQTAGRITADLGYTEK